MPSTCIRRVSCLLGLGSALALIVTACSRSQPQLSEDTLAQVGDRRISTQDLADEIKRRGSSAHNEEEASRIRRDLLSHLIDEETVVQRAIAAGLDRDPDVQRRIRKLLAQEFRERSLESRTNAQPSDAELSQWYHAHLQEFTEPARVRGTLISIRLPRDASPEMREAARSKLEEARRKIESAPDPDATLTEMVRTLSDDPSTRRQGGDTGWLVEGRLTRWPEEVVSTLFSLPQTGHVSRVLTTPNACFLIGLKQREPSKVRPLEEVRPKVTHRWLAESKERLQREFVQEGRRTIEIRENVEALRRIPIPQPTSHLAQTPPELPGTSRHLTTDTQP